MDLVRRALEEVRPPRGRASTSVRAGGPRRPAAHPSPNSRRRWSGPGPDGRDPATAGRCRPDLASTRGWSPKVAEGAVFAEWRKVVGEQIAEHAQPTALRDGVLSVSAESTAWSCSCGWCGHRCWRRSPRRSATGGDRGEDHRPQRAVVAEGPRHIPGVVLATPTDSRTITVASAPSSDRGSTRPGVRWHAKPKLSARRK